MSGAADEDLEEISFIEADVSVENDEFEPAPNEDEEYEVEEILNKRIKKGQIEYLVKWKGWDLPEHNTWEHQDHLANSTEVIKEYEIKLQQQKLMMKYGPDSNIRPRGFSRGLEAEKIVGATFETGKIFFSVKWKDCDQTDIVSAKEANLRIPQLVIQFYEERVDWGEEEDPGGPQPQSQTSMTLSLGNMYFSLSTGLVTYCPYLPDFLYSYLPLVCWPNRDQDNPADDQDS